MEAKAISRNNCRAAAAGLFIPMCNCLRDTVRACVHACWPSVSTTRLLSTRVRSTCTRLKYPEPGFASKPPVITYMMGNVEATLGGGKCADGKAQNYEKWGGGTKPFSYRLFNKPNVIHVIWLYVCTGITFLAVTSWTNQANLENEVIWFKLTNCEQRIECVIRQVGSNHWLIAEKKHLLLTLLDGLLKLLARSQIIAL